MVNAVKSSGTHPLNEKITSIVGESRGDDNPEIVSSYSKNVYHLTTARPGILVVPFIFTCYLYRLRRKNVE